jgi:hypothetical protein
LGYRAWRKFKPNHPFRNRKITTTEKLKGSAEFLNLALPFLKFNTTMKHIITCFAILLAFLSACKKDDSFKSNVDLEQFTFLPDSFLCTATKEVPGVGKIPWTANCSAWWSPNKRLQILFTTINDRDEKYIRESLTFGNIIPETGLYQVFDIKSYQNDENLAICTYSRTLSDGDVYDALWACDLSELNNFKVEEIDLVNKIVKGSFNVHLKKKSPGNSGVMYSDHINFKSGQFTARIKD